MKIYQTRAIPKELSRLPLYPPSYSSRLSQAPPELAITPVHLPSTHAVLSICPQLMPVEICQVLCSISVGQGQGLAKVKHCPSLLC